MNIREYIDSKCNKSIKESTVGLTGKVRWKCYNPQKPRERGLEIYCLCDSMNGYIFSITFPIMEGTQQSTSRFTIHVLELSFLGCK
jgi:hypothetical protein